MQDLYPDQIGIDEENGRAQTMSALNNPNPDLLYDPRKFGLWFTEETDESTLGEDSSVSLIHDDPGDLTLYNVNPDQDHSSVLNRELSILPKFQFPFSEISSTQ